MLFFKSIKLKPNCLLTRRPLTLVSGLRSPFFFKKPWSNLPLVLSEHGYKIELFSLPFNNLKARETYFKNHKSRLNNKHVIMDYFTFLELEPHLDNLKNFTLTVVSDQKYLQLKPQKAGLLFHFNPGYHVHSIFFTLHTKWLKCQGLSVGSAALYFIKATDLTWFKFIDHCVILAELDFNLDS